MKRMFYTVFIVFFSQTAFSISPVFTSKAICIGFASGSWDCGSNTICQAVQNGAMTLCGGDRDCEALTSTLIKSQKQLCESSDCLKLLSLGGYCSDISISNCEYMVSHKPSNCTELGEEAKKSKIKPFDFNAVIHTPTVQLVKKDIRQTHSEVHLDVNHTTLSNHTQTQTNKSSCPCCIIL